MEKNNEAWRLLLESLEDKEKRIVELQKREIDLLQKLMKTEENLKELIKVIAEKQFSKFSEEEKEGMIDG